MKPTLALMGFNIDNLSNNTFVIQGIPNGMDATEAKESLETIIEHLLKEEDTEKPTLDLFQPRQWQPLWPDITCDL
jgi:DNA mismatch repair ATPase MutL